ncbi:hypothetical protein ACFU99_17660 [Streptomyces sp. NPDC057654]|uniref:hypothetical protein n=1 Tax=Streptomyces sp. NPDC057654 TaxID=3346196 RepID=UPI00368A74FE
MPVTVSAVLVFALIVAVLLRTGSLRIGSALAAILLGFFLASTGIAPTVRDALNSTAAALSHIGN